MGKSTTASMLAAEGCAVWDADASVHALYGPGGGAVAAVAALAPDAVAAGGVDRVRLRAALARDPTLWPRLEAAVHPLVAADRERFLADSAADIAVLDVPLLYERGIDAECDGVAVASASAATQMARLLARPGVTPEAAALLLSRQMPDAQKRALARWIVPTETLDGARSAVRGIVSEIRSRPGHA